MIFKKFDYDFKKILKRFQNDFQKFNYHFKILKRLISQKDLKILKKIKDFEKISE